MGKVIVIGGANVDIKGRASGHAIPGNSNIGTVTLSAGGVGRNIAENLARLGEDVSLLAMVGDDSNGEIIRASCRSGGIDPSMLETSAMPSGVYLAVLDGNGEMITAINDMRAAEAMTIDMLERWQPSLLRADMLVVDCNCPVACIAWLCELSASHGIPLLIEPISVGKAQKLLGFARAAPVHCITPNRQQLAALTGTDDEREGVARLHRLGFANVVVHCGKDGARVSDGHGLRRVSAFPAPEIADVIGAGDAAVAGLVCGMLAGFDLDRSARLGQAAASLKLQSHKAVSGSVSRDKVFALAAIAQES